MITVDSAKLMYLGSTKVLTGEASEVGMPPTGSRVAVKSSRTGRVVEFKMEKIKRDADHDIQFWKFVPVVPCGVVELIIFND